jgi:uncharacterized delta-60 repeat protein
MLDHRRNQRLRSRRSLPRAAAAAAIDLLEPRRLFAAEPIAFDPTFGLAGIASDFLGGGENVAATASLAVPLSSGKILVAGEVGGQGAQLARLNADGSLDTTYASGGPGLSQLAPALTSVTDLAIQSDGKVVLAGGATDAPAAARFNANGTLDTAFGGDGVVTTPVPSGGSGTTGTTAAVADAVVVQSNGDIVLAGSGTRTIPPADPEGAITVTGFAMLARFLSNGSIDTGLDSDGVLVVDPLGAASSDAAARTTLNDLQLNGGQYVFAGSVAGQGYVARYNTNGTADASFAGDTSPASPPPATRTSPP